MTSILDQLEEDAGPLINNQQSVDGLQQAIVNAPRDIRGVQRGIKIVIRSGAWRKRVDANRNRVFSHDCFLKFVTDPLPDGLDTTVETLKALCRDDVEALDLIDAALLRGRGNPTGENQYTEDREGIVDNVNDSSHRPTGNSRQQAIRKLRTEADKSPEVKAIYDRVIAEEISPHKGMVEAGFRKVPTPLELGKRAYKQMSEAERIVFLAWIDQQLSHQQSNS